MVIIRRWPFLILIFLFSANSHAERFRNSYISFEMPPNWNCIREHTETVCTSRFSQKSKEAIIILTAKEAGPSDTFTAYTTYLKTPKQIQSANGKVTPSKIIHLRDRMINNQKWVDGMHLGSEVTAYYTRYLATIKDRIAILVTFSAHKAHYTKYSNDFIKAIDSLIVVADKKLLNDRPNMPIRPSHEAIGIPITNIIQDQTGAELPPEDSGWLSGGISKILGALFLLIAIGIYAYLKIGNKNKRKKR